MFLWHGGSGGGPCLFLKSQPNGGSSRCNAHHVVDTANRSIFNSLKRTARKLHSLR